MASETTVNESETRVNDADTTERDVGTGSNPSDGFTGWLAASTIRIGVVLVGMFLLLVALGQLSGVDIIGQAAALLGTEVGRWLLVAAVAMALIGVAVYGFRGQSD